MHVTLLQLRTPRTRWKAIRGDIDAAAARQNRAVNQPLQRLLIQPTLAQAFQNSKLSEPDTRRLAVLFLADTNAPFSTLDSPQFQIMLQKCCGNNAFAMSRQLASTLTDDLALEFEQSFFRMFQTRSALQQITGRCWAYFVLLIRKLMKIWNWFRVMNRNGEGTLRETLVRLKWK